MTVFPDSPYGFGQSGVNSASNTTNLSFMTGLPAAWERVQIAWNTIETVNNSPNPPVYHFDTSGCDAAINAIYAAGLNIDFVVQGAPSWHKTNPPGCPMVNVTDPTAGAAFAKAVADRYAGKISAIEIGNEDFTSVSGQSNWSCNDPGFGLPWLKAAYQLIKPAYPGLLIGSFASLSGGIRSDPSLGFPKYWWDIFCTGNSPNQGNLGYGGTQYCDYVTFHFYSGNKDPMNPATGIYLYSDWWQAIHQSMTDANTAHGYPIVPIWTTEFGWTASSNPNSTQVTPAQQQQYLQEVLDSAHNSNGIVTHAFYFDVHGLYLDGNPPTARQAYSYLQQTYVPLYPQWVYWVSRAFGPPVQYSVQIPTPPLTSAYSLAFLATGPMAYYRLDETSGLIAHDISGNGYDAAITSDTTLNQTGLLATDTDTSMLFTANGSITIPSALSRQIATWTAISVVFWVNITEGPEMIVITCDDTNILFYLNGALYMPNSTTKQIVVPRFGGGTLLLTVPASGTGDPLYVDSLFDVLGAHKTADLDEIGILNKVLSPATIRNLWQVGSGSAQTTIGDTLIWGDDYFVATDNALHAYGPGVLSFDAVGRVTSIHGIDH